MSNIDLSKSSKIIQVVGLPEIPTRVRAGGESLTHQVEIDTIFVEMIATLLPVVNVAFSFTPVITDSLSLPLTITLASGSLPAQLSLNSSTGEISGTPDNADLVLDSGDGPGVYVGIQLDITNGTLSAQTNVFSIEVQSS